MPRLLAPAKPKQILVIDDDATMCEMIARTVRRVGFRAHLARDGEEGWQALCRSSYDLVITDNEMPRLTGIKLIERIRAVSGEPPCILISGSLNGLESMFHEIVSPGAVLAKPFSPTALVETIFGLLLRGDDAVT